MINYHPQKAAPNTLVRTLGSPLLPGINSSAQHSQMFHTIQQLRSSPPVLQPPQATHPSPHTTCFHADSPTPCPLGLACASASAHLSSFTFKLGANVCSLVKSYSIFQSKRTHTLYIFLTGSVCIPITPARLRALVTGIPSLCFPIS